MLCCMVLCRDLDYQGLQGYLSDDIGSLSSLQAMYVFFLCGSFQLFLTVDVMCPLSSSGHSLEVWQAWSCVEAMCSLESFVWSYFYWCDPCRNMSNNALQGPIPSSIGNLSALLTLYLPRLSCLNPKP